MNLQVGVKVLIQNDNGDYLFLKRRKALEHGGHDTWDIPGGRIENNESLMDALKREVMEETNLELVDRPRLIAAQDIIVAQKDLHVVRLTYMGEAKGAVVLSDEHVEFQFTSVNEIKKSGDKLDPYLVEVL